VVSTAPSVECVPEVGTIVPSCRWPRLFPLEAIGPNRQRNGERPGSGLNADVTAVRGQTLRNRYLAFIARHDVVWELVFGGLAVLYVGIPATLPVRAAPAAGTSGEFRGSR
jgi:hypothetical protein